MSDGSEDDDDDDVEVIEMVLAGSRVEVMRRGINHPMLMQPNRQSTRSRQDQKAGCDGPLDAEAEKKRLKEPRGRTGETSASPTSRTTPGRKAGKNSKKQRSTHVACRVRRIMGGAHACFRNAVRFENNHSEETNCNRGEEKETSLNMTATATATAA